MQDIAKKAGVTKATVSMVINNDRRITETTRRKVLDIVKDLNYYPNESARKLAKGKTDSIAFVTTRFGSPFIASVMEAFESRALHHNRYVHGIQPYATRNKVTVLEEILKKVLYGRKADAVVILSQPPSEEMVKEYAKEKVPMILIENEMKGAHSVRVDNVLGAFNATDYLIRKGRKSIGFLNGASQAPAEYSFNHTALERQQGYQKAHQDRGLKWDSQNMVELANYEYEEGKRATAALLDRAKKLDALFCAAGDVAAMGAMEEIKRRGLRIPQDIAVVGYDDLLAARMLNPALTTVRQSFSEITAIAFDMAVDSIEGKLTEEKHVVLEPELVVRESA